MATDEGSLLDRPSAVPESDGSLDFLLDAIPANMALIDPSGVIVAVNRGWRAFARANGWMDPASGVGFNYMELCRATEGDETAAAVAEGLRDVLAGRAPGFSIEYPCHGIDCRRWFTCRIAPLPRPDGRRGAVVMHIDITDRRLAEDRVAELNDARYAFICALAHEVRSPLQAIIGFTDLLQGRPDEPRAPEYLGLMRESGQHLLEVVGKVLDLAKAEAGRFELNEEAVRLPALADAAVRTLAGLSEKAGVTVRRADAPEAAGWTLRADRRLLRQALINIASNAIKVSPLGNRVDVCVEPAGAGRVAVRVTDHGPGIAPDDLARIVEPFVQIRSRTDVAGMGTGLGLTLARQFLRLHGGDLEMASALGAGTTVRLLLPEARLLPPGSGEHA